MSVRVRHRTNRIYDEQYAGAWAVLHLQPSAPREVVDAAYRALSRMYHPDVSEADQRAQEMLNTAYEEIRDLMETNR
jgi:DnaJ-class molecular chaperone